MKRDREKEGLNLLDVLSSSFIPVNTDFVVTLSKEISNSNNVESQKKCKILKFTPDWNFDEILSTISRMESQNYPNVFIFIIEVENFGSLESNEEKSAKKVEILLKSLLNFNKNRPMVLQLTSKDENVTEFYFNDENSEEMHEVKEPDGDVTDFNDFPTFLWLYLNGKIENFEDKMLEKLPKVKNSSLILWFLRTLELSEELFTKLISKCIAEGSKSDLLAAIDINFDEDVEIQESQLKYFTESHYVLKSTIQTALRNENQEVIEFFLQSCKNLIQTIPFYDKEDISGIALEAGRINILCDLIEFWDFPFPSYFNQDSITDIRFLGIIVGRTKFFENILAENVEEMTNFFQMNPNLVHAYSLDNKSAFSCALDSGKLQSCLCIMENWSQILDASNFKDFILKNVIFSKVVCSSMEMKDIGLLLDMIKDKTDSKFVSDALKVKNSGDIFVRFIESDIKNIQRFREFFEIMKKFLGDQEIIKMVNDEESRAFTVLQVCMSTQKIRNLAILFTVFKEIFESMNCPQNFKELVKRKTTYNESTILHFAAEMRKKEHHQTLWRLLLNTFDDREELKDFIMEKDENGENFIHNLVIYVKFDVIEFTFKKIKDIFSESQYREILESKRCDDRNLLQSAAHKYNDIKTHNFLWRIFRGFCESDDKFLDILNNVDKNGNNYFHLSMQSTSGEVFEFVIKELEMFTTREKIKKILIQKGQGMQNLVNIAILYNRNLKLHRSLWKIIRNYFDPSEIVDMIKHSGNYGNNLLLNALKFSTSNFSKLTWDEIKNAFSTRDGTELTDYLKCSNKTEETIFYILASRNNKNNLKYFWTEFENCFAKQNLLHQFRELLSQKTLENKKNILHIAAKSYEIELHNTIALGKIIFEYIRL